MGGGTKRKSYLLARRVDGWKISYESIPLIYAIARSKEVSVRDSLQDLLESGTWLIKVTKNLNDWEVNEYDASPIAI